MAAPPSGTRIRTRLRPTAVEGELLALIGNYLGSLYRSDLAERVRIGDVPLRSAERARRKRELTAATTSRWAGSITRATEDQYQLALRSLRADIKGTGEAIAALDARLAAPVGGRTGKVRGYTSPAERAAKQQRRAILAARLAVAQTRLSAGHPAIVAGGRRLAAVRHYLGAAGISEQQWRASWDAARMFFTADGETGAPFGNYTISISASGEVSIALPARFRHHANAARGRYVLSSKVKFAHRSTEWTDRVSSNKSVRYDIRFNPVRGRWYVDASWCTPERSTLAAPTAGDRVLGVDLNADHLAAYAVDGCGNPIDTPITIALKLAGPASKRDGRLRDAISETLRHAVRLRCSAVAIENLGFDAARSTGRETMGRGSRGRRFRRTVAGIPTAQFRKRLTAMAQTAGMAVVVVDPAYTSRWGGQHWKAALTCKTVTPTRHHAASVVIARRALGFKARRRPGVTQARPVDRVRETTGQAARSARGVREHHGLVETVRAAPAGKTEPRSTSTRSSPASKTVREATGSFRNQQRPTLSTS